MGKEGILEFIKSVPENVWAEAYCNDWAGCSSVRGPQWMWRRIKIDQKDVIVVFGRNSHTETDCDVAGIPDEECSEWIEEEDRESETVEYIIIDGEVLVPVPYDKVPIFPEDDP